MDLLRMRHKCCSKYKYKYKCIQPFRILDLRVYTERTVDPLYPLTYAEEPKHCQRVSFDRFSSSFMLPQAPRRKKRMPFRFSFSVCMCVLRTFICELFRLCILFFLLNIWYCALQYFYCIRIPLACAHTQATNNEKEKWRQHH